MRLGKVAFLFLWLTFQACSVPPVETKPVYKDQLAFNAKVIRIIDGDTMEALYEQHPVKIRLAHIDSPERRSAQPFGNNAKKALSDLCFGQMVHVKVQKYDRYKRLIAIVTNARKQVVNQEMVKQGMAWHFKKYSDDPLYAQLEIRARANKTGLWSIPNPIPPWEWRKSKTAAPAAD